MLRYNMEQGKQDINSFHLAGVIPVAGQPLDFHFSWHDCMMPLSPNYLAIHHAVMECAWAGCETIWITCHSDMQPLIRHEVGEYVYDPVWYGRSYEYRPSEVRKIIPTYILEQRKEYRDSIRKRNTYAEVLNILQADIMKKLYKKKLNIKDKKLLIDSMLVTIAGIAAAMKNVG